MYLDLQAELCHWETSMELLENTGGQKSVGVRKPFDRYLAGSLDWRPERFRCLRILNKGYAART